MLTKKQANTPTVAPLASQELARKFGVNAVADQAGVCHQSVTNFIRGTLRRGSTEQKIQKAIQDIALEYSALIAQAGFGPDVLRNAVTVVDDETIAGVTCC